jgi:pimeloyl-ACP methyl ester carboxylesterase
MSTAPKRSGQAFSIGHLEYGPASGWPCILGHGFPYDPHAYDQTAPILAQAGARVIVPYLRGYGPTRFLQAQTRARASRRRLGPTWTPSRSHAPFSAATIGAGAPPGRCGVAS